MQSFYPERFERDMATTEAEWLLRLPLAIGPHTFTLGGACAQVSLGKGALQIGWHPLPLRVIALLRMPRLAVQFAFEGVEADARRHFMQRFDLTMQRGGG